MYYCVLTRASVKGDQGNLEGGRYKRKWVGEGMVLLLVLSSWWPFVLVVFFLSWDRWQGRLECNLLRWDRWQGRLE